jgi:tetratricopeptide (TPR) repeat protein
LEKDASSLAAYTTLGQMYLQQQRLDEARHEFEEIVKRKPDSVPARTMVGMILDVQQKHEESRKVYEGIVSRGGVRAPVAANNLAWIYANRGEQLDLALQLAQEAKQQMPESPEVNDTLGWVYYKKDLRELAVKTLENSVGKDPKNVMFQYHLGLAYAKAGQSIKARRALEEALRLKPDFDGADEARKALASLKS